MGILNNLSKYKPALDPNTNLEQDEKIDKAKEAQTLLDVDPVQGEGFLGLSRVSSVDGKLFKDATEGANELYGGSDLSSPLLNVENDDLTDMAAFGQSRADKWGNGIAKFAGKTSTAALGGLGSLVSTVGAIGEYAFTDSSAEDSFKSIFDNEFQRGLDDLNESMDYNLPNYVSKEEQEMNFFRSLGTANFYANDAFNGLSFIAGAVLTEAMLTAATTFTLGAAAPAQVIATASLLARAKKIFGAGKQILKLGDKATDVAKGLGKGYSALSKAKQASRVTRQLITGAGYEAGVEARHHLDSVKGDLTEKFVEKNGRQPNDQEMADIMDIATQSANSVFTVNLGLVGAGNMLQFPKIFGPRAGSLGKQFGKIVKNAGDDAVTAPYRAAFQSFSKGRNIADAAYHVLKNPFYEGFIEEGGQSWIGNAGRHASAEYYSKKDRGDGLNSTLDLIGALDDTFAETYGSKDTQKEIGLGFILGALGLPTYARTGNNKGKEQKSDRKFEMQGGIFGALKERKELNERTAGLANYMNTNPNAQVAIKNIKNLVGNFSRQTNLQQEMDAALATNNMFAYKNAENDSFFSFMDSRLQAGMYEAAIEDINAIQDSSNEQFIKDFGYESENMTDAEVSARKEEVIQSALTKAKQVKDAYDTINNNPKYANLDDSIKTPLMHALASAENVDIREAQLTKEINEITKAIPEGAGEFTGPTVRKRLQNIEQELKEDDAKTDDDATKLSPEERVEKEDLKEVLLNVAGLGYFDNTLEDARVMESFSKENPNEYAKEDVRKGVMSKLRDLRMLRARRQDLIANYNNLTTLEGQQEHYQQIEYYMDDFKKEEYDRQTAATQKAIAENRLDTFYQLNKNNEIEFEENGKKKYYKFLDKDTLYNVKDATDTIPLSSILVDGNLAPGFTRLDQRAIERRKVKEAVQRIQKTNVARHEEIQKELAKLDERLAKGAEIMREQVERHKRGRDSRGRFVSIKKLESDLAISEALYQELIEMKEKLEQDMKDLQENKEFFDKMLKATESKKALTLQEKYELEERMKQEGLGKLGISGTVLQTDGTAKIAGRKALTESIESSVSRTEQGLQELMDQRDVLEDDIQKTKNYYDVLKDILMEDRFFNMYKEFQKKFPGADPLDPSKFIKFSDEQAALAQQYPEYTDLLVNTPKMYQEFQNLYKARENNQFLEDEFFATEEKLEKLESVLRAVKQRESDLVNMLDQKYQGMEKVQRAVLFGRNYGKLQNGLQAITQEERAVYDELMGIKDTQPAPKSTQDVVLDGPSKTDDFIKIEDNTHTKPDWNSVGFGKTQGIDREDKFENTDTEYMSADQRRFFKFIDNILPNELRNDKYELRALHKGNIQNAGLEQKDIDELTSSPFFNAELTPETADIVLAVYDKKAKKYARHGEDGGLVYSKQALPDSDMFSGVTEENKPAVDAMTAEYKLARKKVIVSTTPVSYRIKGKGRGTAVMQKDAEGNYVKGAALGRLTDDASKLKKIKIEIVTNESNEDGFTTIQEGGNKYKAVRGMPYALHKNYPVPLETRRLTDAEIQTTIQLLAEHSNRLHSKDKNLSSIANMIGETEGQFRPYLNELIGFGRRATTSPNSAKYEIFIKPKNDVAQLHFGGQVIDLRTIDPKAVMDDGSSLYNEKNVEKLKEFLATKNHNINKALLNDNNAYTSYEIDSTGTIKTTTHANYTEYLLEQKEDGTTPPLTTGLIGMSDDVNVTQIKRTYLKYDYGQAVQSPSVTTPVAQTNGSTDLTEKVEEVTGLDSDTMDANKDYNLVVTKANGELVGTYTIVKDTAGKLTIKSDNVNPIVAKIVGFYNGKDFTFNEAVKVVKESSPTMTATLEIIEQNTIPTPKVNATKETNPTSVDQAILNAYSAQEAQPTQQADIEKRRQEELAEGKRLQKQFGIPEINQENIESQINDRYDAELSALAAAPSPVDILAKFGSNPGDPTLNPTGQDLLVERVKEKYVKANIAEETAWFEGKFPGLPIKIVNGLIDGKSYGRTLNSARVLLSDLAQEGTVYHEAFHVVKGRFTTPESGKALEDAYSRLTGITENVEEEMAEEFRTYMLLDGKYKVGEKSNKDSNLIQRFFKSIKDFFSSLLGRGPVKDQQRIQQFFANIKDNTFVEPVNNPDSPLSMDKRIMVAGGARLSVNLSKDLTESMVRIMFGHLFNGAVPGFAMADLLDLSSKNNSEAKKAKLTDLINKSFSTYLNQLGNIASNLDGNAKEDVENLMRLVYSNSESVTESMFDWLRQFKVDMQLEQQDESTKLRDSYSINENNEINVKDMAPAAVKLLIATLPASKKMENTNSAYGLGLVDYKPFFNLVLKKLAGTHSFEAQIAKLENLALDHPTYADVDGVPGPITALIRRLKAKSDSTVLSPNEFKLQRQFRQQFHKFNSEDLIAMYNEDTFELTFIPANLDRESALIMSEFRANFKERVQSGKGPFQINDDTGRIEILPKKAFKLNGKSVTIESLGGKGATISERDAVSFLELLGIEFTNPETLTTRQRQDILNELIPSQGTGILSKMIELGNEGTTIEDIFSRESGTFNRFKKIIDIQADRTEKSVDLQFQTADGKTAYSVITNNFMTNIIGRLNSGVIPSYLRDPQTGKLLESVQGSIFLEAAMDGLQIGMGSINGIKKDGNRQGFVFQDNAPSVRFRAEVSSTLAGYIPVIRASEKKTEFTYNLNKKNDDGQTVYDKMPKTADQYVDRMLKYLRQEMYKAKTAHGNNISDYQVNKNELRLFDYVKSVNLEDIAGVNEIDAYIEENIEAIKSDIKEHLTRRTEVMFDQFLKNKVFFETTPDAVYTARISGEILSKAGIDYTKTEIEKKFGKEIQYNRLLKGEAMELAKKFVMLSEVGNIEQTISILGDVGFFKPSAFFKRTSGPHGPKMFADTSLEVNDWLKQNYERQDGKSPDGKLNTIVYRDVKGTILNDTFLTYATSFGADAQAMQMKLENPEMLMDAKTEEVYGILAPYLEFDEGDAQGYITIDEYMEFLERVGNVTPEQRAAYKKVQEGKDLSAEEAATFEPLKPQYYGPTYNQGIYTPAFYKLSLLPIYPQVVNAVSKGSALSKMLDDMQKNQAGISVFESGVKIGKVVDVDGNANDFYNEAGDYSQIEPDNIQELYYEYMGIQVETQGPIKTKVTKGSQARALLASNAYSDGAIVNKKVAALDKKLQTLENELIDAEFEATQLEFGLTEENDGYVISEEGYEKFTEVLRKQAESRDMSDSYLEGLEEFLSGEVRLLDVLNNKPKIENLLYSLIGNRVVNYKTFGGSKVQVASTGFESTQRAVYQDKHKYGANVDALKFYRREGDGVKAMQVMLPHYFKELIGDGVTIKEDGVYRDGEKIGGTDLLEIYGFRIPTSALNSIEAMEIAGFLPQEAGNAIMVPSEIVVKAGSDYDIDKLTLFFPNYKFNRATNKVERIPFLNNSNSTAAERVEKLRQLDPRKYMTLANRVGLGESATNTIQSLTEEFKKLKTIDAKNYQRPEVQDITAEIDNLYAKRRRATRAQKDALDIEIGMLEMNRMATLEDSDTGLDVSIQTLKSKINDKFKDIDAKITNAVTKQDIPLEKQNSTQAIQNEILTASRKIVLDPNNFEQLIRPVGAQRLKDMANIIRGIQGKSQPKIGFSSLMDFEYIQDMATRFWEGKKALGLAAVANTHQIKAQRAGLRLDISPTVDAEGNIITYNIGMPSYDVFEDDGRVTIPVGGTRDALGGNYVSEVIGELINAFVDVSKDPFVFDINANLTTGSTFIALLRAGVPLEFVSKFMTQPVIVEMVAQKRENAILSKSKILEYLQEDYQSAAKEIRDLYNTIDKGEVEYSLPTLNRMLALESKAKEYEALSKGKTPQEKAKILNKVTAQDISDYYKFQAATASKYRSHYKNLAIPLQALSEAIVGDRGGMAPKNRMSARLQLMRLNNLKAENKFDNLDKYIEGSFQKSFEDVLEKSSKLFNSMFATDVNEDAAMIQEMLLRDVLLRDDITNEDKAKFADSVENNMVSFILQTISTENQAALFNDASRLFQGTKDTPSLARRIQKLKKETTKKSIILDELFPMMQTYDPRHPEYATENIKKFNKRLTSFERNALIEDMQGLMEKDPELAKDIVKFIILQSGQQTSPISFMDLIPAQQYMEIVNPILSKYLSKNSNINLDNFRLQFYRNNYKNPFVVPEYTKQYINQEDAAVMDFIPLPKGRTTEVRVSGRKAKQTASPNVAPQEFITVLVEDNSLTADQKKQYKAIGKSTKTKKLFKLTEDSKANYTTLVKALSDGKKPQGKLWTMVWEQIPTLGNGMFLTEYGPRNLISMVNRNNKMLDGKDYSDYTKDENRIELRKGKQSIVGDIFNIEGTPIIPVDKSGKFGNGLAKVARAKGLPVMNSFTAKPSAVSAPIRESYGDPVNFTIFADTVGKIDKLAKSNPKLQFLLPPLGLEPGSKDTQKDIDTRIVILKSLIDSNPNVTLVIPNSTNPALAPHIETLSTIFEC